MTGREIGTWLCGRRAAHKLNDRYWTGPEIEALALTYAEEDTVLAASMRLKDYVYWFCRGFESVTDAPAVS